MDYFFIDISGQQFKKNYLLYIITITHREMGQYFYIGQTGDRNYLTARPAFRRLSGHFSDQGSSTENQVYRHIAVKILNLKEASKREKFSPIVKSKLTEFLCDSQIKMHVFSAKPFLDTFSLEQHKINLTFIESLERNVINKMIENYHRDRILNDKIFNSKVSVDKEILELTNQIIDKIQGR